jgi:hypothetical protein
MVQGQGPWLSDQDECRASSIQGCFRLTARSRGDALRARLNADVEAVEKALFCAAMFVRMRWHAAM